MTGFALQAQPILAYARRDLPDDFSAVLRTGAKKISDPHLNKGSGLELANPYAVFGMKIDDAVTLGTDYNKLISALAGVANRLADSADEAAARLEKVVEAYQAADSGAADKLNEFNREN